MTRGAQARVRMVEGVPWYRYCVRFSLRVNGRYRSRTRHTWSPGPPWVYGEIARGLADEYGIDNIKPGSVQIARED